MKVLPTTEIGICRHHGPGSEFYVSRVKSGRNKGQKNRACLACGKDRRAGRERLTKRHQVPKPGDRYGRLVVMGPARFVRGKQHRKVPARCDCGRELMRDMYSLGPGSMCTPCKQGSLPPGIPKVCRWCERDESEAEFNTLEECETCERRGTPSRNGRCPACSFPLYKSKPHVCEEGR